MLPQEMRTRNTGTAIAPRGELPFGPDPLLRICYSHVLAIAPWLAASFTHRTPTAALADTMVQSMRLRRSARVAHVGYDRVIRT
jgi:hypothetical protein